MAEICTHKIYSYFGNEYSLYLYFLTEQTFSVSIKFRKYYDNHLMRQMFTFYMNFSCFRDNFSFLLIVFLVEVFLRKSYKEELYYKYLFYLI